MSARSRAPGLQRFSRLRTRGLRTLMALVAGRYVALLRMELDRSISHLKCLKNDASGLVLFAAPGSSASPFAPMGRPVGPGREAIEMRFSPAHTLYVRTTAAALALFVAACASHGQYSYFAATGHYCKVVRTGYCGWRTARDLADSMNHSGLPGHLVCKRSPG